MPRLVVQLSQEEFDRLRDRALFELRHPRHTARLLLRDALDLPERKSRDLGASAEREPAVRGFEETERVSA